jgi:SET domain-containing protein
MESNNFGLPHTNVYVRLKPSKIHGVGVFAICNIKKGTNLFPFGDKERILWLGKKQISRVRGEHRKLYDQFSVRMGDMFGVPEHFSRIVIAWYMNHSFKPNAFVDQDYRAIAARNIKKGEEITINYLTFTDMDIPKNWK